MGIFQDALTTPRISPKKLTLTVVQLQQLPDIERTNSKEESSCLIWIIYNGRRQVCEKFKTDTDKFNFIVYRYQNSFYLRDNEVDLKLTEYQSPMAK